MIDSRIKFSTQILKRLGEELNPSMDQGVLELVKNAYDADARVCKIRISEASAEGGTIEITDDGIGMEPEDIESGWLVLGSSRKRTTIRTALGRVPAGNKGLGRLAALRLGKVATLSTVSSNSQTETEVVLDWDAFDQADLIEDVPVLLRSEPSVETPGTRIRITDLRHKIGRVEVKRLARALLLLADPFGSDSSGFRPILEAKEFTDLENLVSSGYFSEAEYHLTARLINGEVSAEVRDWRGQVLWSADHDVISRAAERYEAPDGEFDFWTYSLNGKNFSTRTTTLKEVREWLGAFGGVHVYSNGLRVSPYGNPGNDWLDINLSRARSPEERPSTNNSIGRVLLKDFDGLLIQKTDRSGIIESHGFEEIRRFANDCLEWMARQRLAKAEMRRQRQRQESGQKVQISKRGVEQEISKLPQTEQEQISSAFKSYAADRDRREAELNREVQLYRTLSTTGITTAVFAHESAGGGLKVIEQSINSIDLRSKRFAPDNYETHFKKPVQSVREAAESLGVLSLTTLRLLDQDKRRVSHVNLHNVIKGVVDVFQPFLSTRDVTVRFEFCPGFPYLLGSEAAIESVLTNLINNSLGALEKNSIPDKTILISTEVVDNSWVMNVSDNGPGIKDITIQEVWLPGQTRRRGGTGLGLTIVKDAVTDLEGSVRAFAVSPLGGARFQIKLPILGVNNAE